MLTPIHCLRYFLWLGFMLVGLSSFAQSKQAYVVLDPQKTVIVHYTGPGDNNVLYAANVLQKWLRKVYQTQTGFEVVYNQSLHLDPGAQRKFIIAVGSTFWEKARSVEEVGKYGFAIQRKNNVVTIVGSQGMGTLMGSIYFLDKFCGVRLYMPDDLFTSLPKDGKVNVPSQINIVEKPFTDYVMGTGFLNQPEANLNESLWATYHGFLLRRDWGSHQHSMFERFPPEKFARKYPEIYPVFKGKRYIPQHKEDQKWQPDFAEPHLVDAAVESATDYFKQNPGLDRISFSVQDSRQFANEGKMRQLLKRYPDTPEGQTEAYTEQYIHFLNQVALRLERELPKNGIKDPKTVVYLSYNNVNAIPKQKLHPNVLPIPIIKVAEMNMKEVLTESNGKNPLSVADWLKVTKRFGFHDWAHGNGYFFPRIYSSLYVKLLRYIRDQGADLEYVHIECYPNWGLDGPKYYIISKVLWSPDTDVDQLLTQFCNDMFGRGSAEMNSYFTTLETLSIAMNNNWGQMRKLFMFPQQFLLNEQEKALVQKARYHLDRAAKKARKPEEKQRIELFSKTFRLSEYLFEVANAKEVKRAKVEEIKKYVSEVIAPDKRTIHLTRNPRQLHDYIESALRQSTAKKLVD